MTWWNGGRPSWRAVGGGALLAAALVAGTASRANAVLTTAGPVDPANGFPTFYSDANGLSLGQCLLPGPICAAPPIPNEANPVSFPGNFPDEWFYERADANLTYASGTALLEVALEGSFVNAPLIAAGDQITFARLRVRATGLVPGATYTVTHPYGTSTFVAVAGVRSINDTVDVGIATPGVFTTALGGTIGPFLVWDPISAAPAGFIGDGATPHVVTGSPLNQNFFRLEGPGINSSTCVPAVAGCAQTNLWTVAGKIFGGSVSSVSHANIRLANVGTPLTVTGTAAPDATLVTVGLGTLSQTAVPASGAWSVTFSPAQLAGLADGPVSLVVTITTPSGSITILNRTITKDTLAPGPVTGLSATGGNAQVSLAWSNPGVDVATVRILRSTANFAAGPDDTVGQTVVFDAAGTSFVDTGLVNGTNHFYSVFVIDPVGNASTAAQAQATPVAPPPTGAFPTVFSDNFNLCTSTTNLGANWTVGTGWSCVAQKARGATANGVALSRGGPLGDSEAEARLLLDGAATNGSGVVIRANASSWYAARILNTGRVEIVRVSAGVPTVLGSVAVPFTAGTFNRIALRATGTTAVTLNAFWNGVAVLSVVDTSASRLTTGTGGLLSGTVSRTQFDDYFLRGGAATTPPPPPPPPPPGGTSFADNFDACTSTVDLGPNWTTTGRWLCAAGRARGEVANRATAHTAALGDTTVQARLNPSTSAATGSGVFARGDATSYYAARLLTTGRLQIVRVIGATTLVFADVPVSFPIGSFSTVKLQVSGAGPVSLTATYNGAPVAFATDATALRLTTGSAGLLSGATARTQFDDVKITSP